MSNEEKELKLIIGDDGVLREYNDEFDIIIHCESQEEADNAIQKLEHINDLRDYRAAITDHEFLEMYFGITDIDIRFVRAFNPDAIIKNYKKWRDKNEQCKKNVTDVALFMSHIIQGFSLKSQMK